MNNQIYKIKKNVLNLLIFIMIIILIGIFIIGGKISAYLWNITVFIFAPLAIIALLIQLILLFIKILKRKNNYYWNIIFIIITIIYSFPITILIGISPITYPLKIKNDKAIIINNPIKNGIVYGGKNYKSHAMWPSECYAFDILKKPYNIKSNILADYGIFGEDIYSPVSGTVIGMKNDEIDIKPNTEKFKSFAGNYIYIKIDSTKTYLILAHLKQNSITVKIGDKISEGDIIAKVGNSGTTSEPHLHIQHQLDNPLKQKISLCAVSLPIIFKK